MEQSRRASLFGKLILAAVFLTALAGTSFWILHEFLPQPPKTVILLPKDLRLAKPKPPANPPPRQPAAISGPAIGGIVVNESGRPVPNARVTLSFQTAGAANQRTYHSAQVRTDGNGNWSSTDVPRDSIAHLRFNITQRDYAALSVPSAFASDLLAHQAQFAMTRGLDLSGIVVNDAGLPLIGAKITAGRDGSASAAPPATSATNGKFTLHHLPSGQPLAIVATLPDFAPSGQSITPASGMTPLRLVLTPGQTLSGKVTDAHGQPIPDARVLLSRWLNTYRPINLQTTTDAGGEYRLPHMPPNVDSMEVGKDGYIGVLRTIAPGQTTLDFQMDAEITVHGSVTDAQTHQPIPRFTVVTGVKWAGSDRSNFQRATGAPFANGRFRQTLTGFSGNIDAWYVRVEAPGYLPLISSAITQSGRQDFQLTHGADLTGHILSEGGKPVPGVTVALATSNDQIEISSAEFPRDNNIQSLTDSSGKFDLPPQTGNFALVAISTAGVLLTNQDALAKSTDLHLNSWGRVQGTLMIGSKPGVKQQIQIAWRQPGPYVAGAPRVIQNITTQTDASGHFSADSVMPGTIRVSRVLQTDTGGGRTIWNNTATESATVIPGDTATINLGGAGRPVTGKVILPPQLPANHNWYFSCRVFGGAGRLYSAPINADGSFRIDDVRPGAYQFILSVQSNDNSLTLAQGNERFTVPPIPGGVSDEPLAIPDIPLTMAKQ